MEVDEKDPNHNTSTDSNNTTTVQHEQQEIKIEMSQLEQHQPQQGPPQAYQPQTVNRDPFMDGMNDDDFTNEDHLQHRERQRQLQNHPNSPYGQYH